MDTISAFEACQSYGYRYAVMVETAGLARSVYGLYSSKRAAKHIAAAIYNDYKPTTKVYVAKIVE